MATSKASDARGQSSVFFDSRLFRMAAGVRWRILLAAAVGLIAVGAGVTRLAVSGDVIARVFQGEAEYSALTAPLLAVAGLIVLRGIFQYIQHTYSHHTASLVKLRLRRRLYEHALALGPGHFDQRRTGDVILTMGDGVEALETFFGEYLPQILVAAAAPVLVFVFMAILDLQIALIFLAFALFTLVAPAFFHRWNHRSSAERRRAYGDLGAEFLDAVQGLATLKAFGQSGRRGDLLADRARSLYRTTMGVLAANIATGAGTIFGITAGAAVALAVGALRVADGDLEMRTLLIVLMLGVEVFRPLRELTQLYHQGMVAMAASQSIFALLDTRPEITSPPARPDPAGKSGLSPEIVFEGVGFSYSGGRRAALDDVSFTLKPGEKLGLVGPSGAGKSTIVWLILRLYDPQSGRVLLGGRDVRELPVEQLRSQVAVVTQDTYLFSGTVADNLRFGRPDATSDELESAARAANAHDFISSLPDGYDTVVGERAVRLSGGQRQRIAIARALLKDAPILVLDEALSSVDAENERTIQSALERLMEGRTTLVIAHRLSSVVDADRIIVLDGGRLVESGSHESLVSSDGVYADLMANQRRAAGSDLLVETLPDVEEPDETRTAEESPATGPSDDGRPRSATPTRQGATAVWRRLAGLVRPWWWQQITTFLLGIAHHGSIIGVGVTSALLVGNVFQGEDTTFLIRLLGVFVVTVAIFHWAESWLAHDLAYRLLAEVRIDLYRKLDPLAPAYTVTRRSGDIVSVVGGDTETLEFFFAHTISPTFVAIVLPIAVMATLSFVAWPLALVLLPFLVGVAATPFIAQGRAERLGAEVRSGLGEIHAHMTDNIQGMREIVAFGRGPARLEEIDRHGQNFASSQLQFRRAQASQAATIEALTGLGGLAVLAIGAWLVLQGDVARPEFPLATILAMSTFQPVTDIARTLKQLMESLAASRRIFEVHDESVPVADGPGVASTTDGRQRAPGIHFDDVAFAYRPGLPPALSNVAFEVSPGETVALVGRSGAGKTTCAYLLMRFWDPGGGSILLDGSDLRDHRLDALRARVALVSQDTYLFNSSIRDNVLLAKPDAALAEFDEAVGSANVSEFVESFPDGFDTLVGERGMQLSGGQRQRVSIARALLKDAPVLVLDEATSHLDAVNEQQVREAVGRLQHGRTTLVIAHRLSTVQDADKIVMLDAGRVVETGTHDELLATHGLYAQLVRTQLVGVER